MKVVVAGGTGFLGRYISRALMDAGHEVTVLGRDPDKVYRIPKLSGAGAVRGDVTDPAIALVSMGATPLRAAASEAAWAAGDDPGAVAADGTDPPTDTNGSAEYRRHLGQVLVRRATEEATRR